MKLIYGFVLGALLAGIVGYACWYDATHISLSELKEMEHASSNR